MLSRCLQSCCCICGSQGTVHGHSHEYTRHQSVRHVCHTLPLSDLLLLSPRNQRCGCCGCYCCQSNPTTAQIALTGHPHFNILLSSSLLKPHQYIISILQSILPNPCSLKSPPDCHLLPMPKNICLLKLQPPITIFASRGP